MRPQQQHDDGVGHQARQRDDDHRHAGDIGRIAEPLERLVEDEGRDADQQHRVGDRGEHLGAVPPVGPRGRSAAAAGEQHRRQAHEHRHQVGQHVAGVGQQRDRIDQQRGGELENEEAGQDGGGDQHPADTGIGTAVVVARTHGFNLCAMTHMSQGVAHNQADQNRVRSKPTPDEPAEARRTSRRTSPRPRRSTD